MVVEFDQSNKMTSSWVVHKFGGTSVAGARGYQAVGRILRSLRSDGERAAVVVSAMSGVTDGLIELVSLAASQNDRRHPPSREHVPPQARS